MSKIQVLLFFILIFLNISDLYAQSIPGVRFERISVEQGLSQSTVHCIMQDNKGFMWFGTWDGLNRYDGYDFKVFKNDPDNPFSLSHNSIRALCEDAEGMIWIGTEGGGLNRFDPEHEIFTRYQNHTEDPFSLSHNNVRAVCETSKGILWIGTEDGLNRFDPETGKFIQYKSQYYDPLSLSSSNIQTIYEDGGGILWIGTVSGLNRFDYESEKFIRYENQPGNPASLSNNNIRAIYESCNGTLWIGTGKGLNIFDSEKGEFTAYYNQPDDPFSLSHNEIRAVYEDHEGRLWIGTEGGGLCWFIPEKEIFITYQNQPDDAFSLSHNVVWSLYQDRSGILWIGTYTGGINKFDSEKEQFVLYKNIPGNPNSLSHNVVWSIYEDHDEILWIGTENGLNRFDRDKNEFTHYKNIPGNPRSLSHNEVWSIYEDRNRVLWTGTYSGLNRFDRNMEAFTRHINKISKTANKIRTIYEDYTGMLWVGTGDGLSSFDRDKEEFTTFRHDPDDPYSLSHDNIWIIYEDKAGMLWIGTEGGLNRFDRELKRFIRYQNDYDNPGSLSDNWVISIYESNSGILWIGTLHGLNRFDRQGETFTRYRVKDGLPDEVIYGICEDSQGYLWLSTNKGLSKFSPWTETFKNYDVKDGLQGNEFNAGAYHKNRKGEMFFGGINGFNSFYPTKSDNPYLPLPAITDFQIYHESVPVNQNSILKKNIIYTQEIHLSWNIRVFSFEFTALHYSNPEKNQYAYMMEGFDEDWTYTDSKRRFATYTNLAPGTYRFRVKASNNDGLWNEEGTSLKIIIIPPWWDKTGFRILMLAVLMCIILGIFRWRIHAVKKQSRKLEIQVAERTQELVQSEAALRESERAMKTLVSNLPGIAYRCKNDRRWKMEFISRACFPMTGYQPHEFINNEKISFAELIHPDDREGVWSAVQASLKDKRPFQVTYRIIDKDGNEKWVREQGQGVFNEKNEVVALEGLINDITETRQIHEALKEAKEAAEMANRFKSEFIANMSHEIRTPMNAILGFSELLSEKITNPQHKSYLTSIHNSGMALLSLIDDILDLSKIEAGRMDIESEPVNIRELINGIESIFYRKIQEKNLCWKLDISSSLPRGLILDEVRIRQVLINLIGNAVKFTHQGYVRLAVYSMPENYGTDEPFEIQKDSNIIKLIFEVEDTGIGIPLEQREVIFESFRQQEGQKTKKYGGTGLGLTITKKLTEMMNGRITLMSEEGRGSTFRVILSGIETSGKLPERRENPVYDDTRVRFKSGIIMIVDDVLSNRELIKGYLQNSGFSFLEAENGEKALYLLEKENSLNMLPNLIFMDLRMPGKSGYEITDMIKKMEKLKHIPVIACTASAMKHEIERLNSIFDGYLFKPVNQTELISELKRFLPYQIETNDSRNEEAGKEIDAAVSCKIKERLPEILKLLDDEIIPEWQEVNEVFFIDEIAEFAMKLKNIAEEYHIDFLGNYSRELYKHTHDVNIEEMEKMINDFLIYVDKIKAMSEPAG